jgi:hypothetical protein
VDAPSHDPIDTLVRFARDLEARAPGARLLVRPCKGRGVFAVSAAPKHWPRHRQRLFLVRFRDGSISFKEPPDCECDHHEPWRDVADLECFLDELAPKLAFKIRRHEDADAADVPGALRVQPDRMDPDDVMITVANTAFVAIHEARPGARFALVVRVELGPYVSERPYRSLAVGEHRLAIEAHRWEDEACGLVRVEGKRLRREA